MAIETPARFKLLVTDLDGTAIPMFPTAMPSERVIEAVHKAQKKIMVSVATGRPYSMTHAIIKALGITNDSIFHGGSQIRNPVTGERIWSQRLTPKLMSEIMEVCSPMVYQTEGDEPEIKGEPLSEPCFTGNQDMMVVMCLDPEEGKALHTKLQTIKEINALFVHSWVAGKWDIHISHIGASKRHALEVLLARLGVEKHEVIAVGDSANDVPLFEGAGFKVAMGNASDDLKEQADFVTDTVGDDGLAKVIEKYIL